MAMFRIAERGVQDGTRRRTGVRTSTPAADALSLSRMCLIHSGEEVTTVNNRGQARRRGNDRHGLCSSTDIGDRRTVGRAEGTREGLGASA